MHKMSKKSGGVKTDTGMGSRVSGDPKTNVGAAGSISRGGRKSAKSISRGK